jgi:hypothetical protein
MLVLLSVEDKQMTSRLKTFLGANQGNYIIVSIPHYFQALLTLPFQVIFP